MNRINELLNSNKDFLKSLREIAEDEGLDVDELAANVANQMISMKDRAQVKARKLATNIDESAHDNPWPFIGVGALAGFLAGYFLMSRR